MDRAIISDPGNAELEAVQRLQSFFNSDMLSDLIILFSGHKLKAHKVILCIHSEWFAKAFRGGFLGASASILELHDDDPRAVEGMLRYFYDLDPMSPCEGSPSIDKQTELSAKLKHIVHLYAVADKYDIPMLRKDMLPSFMALSRKHWLDLWSLGELSEIIETIYAFTARSDRLRSVVVELSLEYIDKFRESNLDAFRDLLETIPDFSADILMRIPLPGPVKIPFPLSGTQLELLTAHSDQLELHRAAKLGDLAQCKILIRLGKYASARDINDSTPLHFAVFYGRMPIVRFLVQNARADVNACCDHQTFPTPLAWAKYAGHHDIVDYLAHAGGWETR